MRKWTRNVKNEKCTAGYFTPLFSHFAPLFLQFAPGSAFARKLKGFRGSFFHGINKTENSPEMRKCIVNVSHFMVCFAKYLRNTKSV